MHLTIGNKKKNSNLFFQSQIYYLQSTAKSHIELLILQKNLEAIKIAPINVQPVLKVFL